ncbi:MAG: hypothetical protein ASARMPREDX12_001643 [Alectoria sarmentosa]|nr:MAG: hypothetical protein ASARMPREDX12_001643 [Alectoria sarmentosa]
MDSSANEKNTAESATQQSATRKADTGEADTGKRVTEQSATQQPEIEKPDVEMPNADTAEADSSAKTLPYTAAKRPPRKASDKNSKSAAIIVDSDYDDMSSADAAGNKGKRKAPIDPTDSFLELREFHTTII